MLGGCGEIWTSGAVGAGKTDPKTVTMTTGFTAAVYAESRNTITAQNALPLDGQQPRQWVNSPVRTEEADDGSACS